MNQPHLLASRRPIGTLFKAIVFTVTGGFKASDKFLKNLGSLHDHYERTLFVKQIRQAMFQRYQLNSAKTRNIRGNKEKPYSHLRVL